MTSERAARGPFFLVMAIVITAIVLFGFSFTVGENLWRPAYPRPAVLYAHAAVSAAWLALFIAQTALVRLGQVRLHRALGLWGVVHGSLIAPLGLWTAIAMSHVRLLHGDSDSAVSFPIPVNDALGFAVAFTLAVLWRKQHETHRRLMFVACCILTGAAWGRMPVLDSAAEWFYVGVDVLLVVGAVRDRIATGAVHAVYRWALPLVIGGQILTACVRWTHWWLDLAPRLFA